MDMVADSTFDRADFTVPVVSHWYVRHGGWVRGPYSLADMRRFRDLHWISKSVPVSRDLSIWSPAGDFSELWGDVAVSPARQAPPQAPSPHADHWHYSSDGKPMFVVFTIRSNLIRPISARYMHKKEARNYEKNFTQNDE
jgi:hypothetical protein